MDQSGLTKNIAPLLLPAVGGYYVIKTSEQTLGLQALQALLLCSPYQGLQALYLWGPCQGLQTLLLCSPVSLGPLPRVCKPCCPAALIRASKLCIPGALHLCSLYHSLQTLPFIPLPPVLLRVRWVLFCRSLDWGLRSCFRMSTLVG